MARQAQAQVEVPHAVVEVAKPIQPKYDLVALMTEHKTKSAVIRHLSGLGETRAFIAKLMGIRYQHVRNVLTQPLKAKSE